MSRFAQQAIYVIIMAIALIGSAITYYLYIFSPISYSLEPAKGTSITYQMSSQNWFDFNGDVELKWDVEGVKAVFFNQNGAIGHDSRIKEIDICDVRSYDLQADLDNGESVVLTLTPTVAPFINFIIVIWFLLALLIFIWLKLFYHFDVIYFLAMIFFFVFAFLLATFVMPTCTNIYLFDNIGTQPLNVLVNIATLLASLAAFVIILIKPQFAKHAAQLIRSNIHPILFGAILLVWGGMLCWVGIVWLDTNNELFIYYCLAIYLFILGVSMIYIGQLDTTYLIICTVLSIAILTISTSTVKGSRVKYDANQNQRLAYNLTKYQVFSIEAADTPLVSPTLIREPAYPFYQAAVLHFFTDIHKINYRCLNAGDSCEWIRLLLNLANVPLYIMLVWVFIGSAYLIIHNWWIVSGLAILLFSIDAFLYTTTLTELPAALFLLLHALFLYKVGLGHESKHRLYQYAIGSGISLGLLVLTKAIFLYWIVVLGGILILSYLLKLFSATQYRSYIVLILTVTLVTSPWLFRNYVTFGELKVAGRDSTVLAVRAEYSFLTGNEYVASFAAFSPPFIRPYLLSFFEEEDYYRLRRQWNGGSRVLDSYHFRGVLNTGHIAQRAQEQFGELNDETIASVSLATIRENWIQHLALILSFAWRGSFFDIYNHTLPFNDILQVFLMFFPIPSMLVVTVYSMKKRHWAMLLFLLPALYSFGIYAALTHYIPRYTTPLVPILFITLGLVFKNFIGYIQKRQLPHHVKSLLGLL